MKLSKLTTLMLASTAGLALGAGATFAAAAASGASDSTSLRPVQTVQTHVFERNAAGQTFGSELDAATPADAPDLIEAYATNGALGYLKKADLFGAGPASPQAALAAQVTGPRVIPVVARDGVTPVGVFELTVMTGIG